MGLLYLILINCKIVLKFFLVNRMRIIQKIMRSIKRSEEMVVNGERYAGDLQNEINVLENLFQQYLLMYQKMDYKTKKLYRKSVHPP